MKTQDRYLAMEKNILVPILNKFNVDETNHKYILSFYVQGILGILNEWIKDDCKDDVDKIKDIIIGCVNHNLGDISEKD